MELEFRALNPGGCRTYLIGARGSGEAALIDPALVHLPDYLHLLDRERLKLTHVLDTHTHADHISGAAALRDHTGAEYVMHAKAPAKCVTSRVADGDEIELAGARLKALHTPGHTQDGICLVLPERVLTGDTLFLDEGGAGRDDLPGGDPGEHYDSLQRILGLPEALTVHPAHEYRGRAPSDLGRQKRTNPHFRPRSKTEFVQYLQGLCLGPADWMKEVLKANCTCSRDPNAVMIPTEGAACEVQAPVARGGASVGGIGPDDLTGRLERGENPVLLDVREIPELVGEFGHLPGIVHIPLGEVPDRLPELDESRDREIVVICKAGPRSIAAAQFLAQSGFPKVVFLAGGMMRWKHEGHPSVR
ncbi:MAG TPA: MBL fold metallo-hydrolase [Planctomycetota bacterium]